MVMVCARIFILATCVDVLPDVEDIVGGDEEEEVRVCPVQVRRTPGNHLVKPQRQYLPFTVTNICRPSSHLRRSSAMPSRHRSPELFGLCTVRSVTVNSLYSSLFAPFISGALIGVLCTKLRLVKRPDGETSLDCE